MSRKRKSLSDDGKRLNRERKSEWTQKGPFKPSVRGS